MSLAVPTSVEEKALKLLGDGISQDVVASATGVSVGRISQLMSDEGFKNAVLELRYKNLAEHSIRDSKIDALEDRLLDKLDRNIGMLYDPMKIAAIWSKVNAAKRKGQSAPETLQTSAPTQEITLPRILVNQFITNIHNQIIAANGRELLTIQSGKMNEISDADVLSTTLAKENTNVLPNPTQKTGTG